MTKDINVTVLSMLHKANNQSLNGLTMLIINQKGNGNITRKDIQKSLVLLKRRCLVECVNNKWMYIL